MLDQERYSHLKGLAFLAHLVESQSMSPDTYKEVALLAEEFDEKFRSLYGVSIS